MNIRVNAPKDVETFEALNPIKVSIIHLIHLNFLKRKFRCDDLYYD